MAKKNSLASNNENEIESDDETTTTRTSNSDADMKLSKLESFVNYIHPIKFKSFAHSKGLII